MSENKNKEMAEFAENLWQNYIRPKMLKELTNSVTYYKAKVTQNNGSGKAKVKRPFSTATTATLSKMMLQVPVNTQVLVMQFGDGNAANHIVVSTASGDYPVQQKSFVPYGRGVKLESGTDLDNVTEVGTYYCANSDDASGMSNLPRTGTGFRLEVIESGNSNYRRQIFFSNTGTNSMYTRHKQSTWSSWQQIV